MALRIHVDFRDRLALPRVERNPDGALRLTLTREPEQFVVLRHNLARLGWRTFGFA
jgi:hypothetical protein